MSDQLQYPQQQQDMHSNDSGDAARERRMLEAFKDGPPRGPDGSIDFWAAVHLLMQHGADQPTLKMIIRLAEAQQRELQQREQQQTQDEPTILDFGEALMGRPRQSSVVGFSPRSARWGK
jgi:hypothetical protein